MTVLYKLERIVYVCVCVCVYEVSEVCNTDFTLILHDREYVQRQLSKMKNICHL
jgi:hypothetical protein